MHVRIIAALLLAGGYALAGADDKVAWSAAEVPTVRGKALWARMIDQAERLTLPTRFIRAIPPDFLSVEFSDLRTFAAEYHVEEHRMILDRSLSFNAAGGTLRPMSGMTHREIGTLYHELFHAYMDYIVSISDGVPAESEARLLAFARQVQQCRYLSVEITPLRQKKTVTESRLLSERESWEALNETWAVFVGWRVWTKLDESQKRRKGKNTGRNAAHGQIADALKLADQAGDLVGYYEPEDPQERAITHKRYLASANRISADEVAMLLEIVFETSPQEAMKLVSVMSEQRSHAQPQESCRTN
jgi:hypothetical protein